MAFNTNQQIVAEYYQAAFNRAPDQEGFTFWTSKLDDGTYTPATLLNEFLNGDYAEVEALYPDTQTNEEKIESFYVNVFDRESDEGGLAYWVEQLDTMTETEVLAAMLAEAKNNTDDAATLATKLAAAEEALDTTVVEPTEPETEGNTYELTSGTDKGADFTGTDDADTFDASIAQNSFTGGISNTLSSADKLDGGAGTDTLNAEVVAEFVGAVTNQQSVIDVQPQTKDIEIVTFEARDDNSVVTVDAKDMTGVEKIGSLFSDGDLIIENLTTLSDEGVIRNTSDMTITMDHTDNMNSDKNASDLTVYFDEDYLNTTTSTSGSTLTLKISNVLNMENNVNPVEGFQTVNFTVGDVAVDVDVSAVASYQDVADAINDRLDELGLDTVTATLGTAENAGWSQTTTIDGTTYNFGDVAGQLSPVIITNTGSEDLVKGEVTVSEGGNEGDINKSWQDTSSQESTNPISINVELEKVGRDAEGGNLVIGGKSDDENGDSDVDQNDGIEIFNITVLGGEDKPSNLGTIQSTNDFLDTVNISSDNLGEKAYAALTVRGDLTGTFTGTTPFGGTLSTLNANAFLGDLNIGEEVHALNIDTFTATGGGDVTLNELISGEDDVDYSVTTGAGEDNINIILDGDSVDAEGEGLTISTGANDDTVTVSGEDNVSDETTLALENLNITTGTGEDTVYLNTEHIYNVKTGADSDFVVVDADTTTGSTGTWTIGDGSDAAGTDWADSVLYEATVTVDFAGFEQTVTVKTTAANNFVATQADINAAVIDAIETNEELARLLETEIGSGTNSSQLLTITSTVKGVNDLTISVNQPTVVAAAGAPAGSTTILASEYAALEAGLLETGAVADSAVIGTVTTEANLVTAMATIDGNRTETGAAAASDFVLDSVEAAGASTATDGSNSTGATSHAIIDLGTGANDLVVLDSDNDSADTVVFSAAWDKVSIVNFFDAQYNDAAQATAAANVTNVNHTDDGVVATVGSHILDFTAFLNDSTTTSGSTASAIRTATTEDIVATGADLNLDSNEVVIVNDWTNGGDATESWSAMTAASIDASLEGTDFYGSLVATSAVIDPATNLETGISSILMIENDANQGEYKVFNVETNEAAAAGSEFSVTLLGTVDLGESYNVDSAEAVNANFA